MIDHTKYAVHPKRLDMATCFSKALVLFKFERIVRNKSIFNLLKINLFRKLTLYSGDFEIVKENAHKYLN